MVCCKRKGNVRKCIPFYVIAGILILIGLPLMIVGIVGDFVYTDLIGYIGGICILFGLGFLLLWHMFTIENTSRKIVEEYHDSSDIFSSENVPSKKEHDSERIRTASNGFSNLAFEGPTQSSLQTLYKNTEENRQDKQNYLEDCENDTIVPDNENGFDVVEYGEIDEAESHSSLDIRKNPPFAESNQFGDLRTPTIQNESVRSLPGVEFADNGCTTPVDVH